MTKYESGLSESELLRRREMIGEVKDRYSEYKFAPMKCKVFAAVIIDNVSRKYRNAVVVSDGKEVLVVMNGERLKFPVPDALGVLGGEGRYVVDGMIEAYSVGELTELLKVM